MPGRAERRGEPWAPTLVALTTGAGAALVAVAGFRPLTRRWPEAVGASLLAALATELPRPTAAVTAGIAAAAVVAVLALDRRARATERVLAEALATSLGRDAEHGGDPGSSRSPGAPPARTSPPSPP